MTETVNSIAQAHRLLGWPSQKAITDPSGSGASVFASLAREKIGRALNHFPDAKDATIGLLMTDPMAAGTEPPFCIVVEFRRDVAEATLRELHRLAWNFSHCPALITIEPTLVRVWTCCANPDASRPLASFLVHELGPPDLADSAAMIMERKAAQALHWVNLASGEFFRERAQSFDRDGRADQMLLRNLRHIRAELANVGLTDDDVCHDLLARIIFVQFLFDRKDSDGNAALTPAKLARLYNEGILRRQHDSFSSILSNYDDTYRLFEWLNDIFNGDLFPGKGDTPTARNRGWAAEKRIVTRQHLALLADFVSGKLDMPSGQGCLWSQYAFDVIPLEFISSIYETFVTERAADEGIFYTPPHLVDFVLDKVLPWDGDRWDLTVLDPACGSGIFLVKTFQRLIFRWKRANPGVPMRAETLRRLLERNLFGVDKDPHAVRVACFSLYLAMCDEIDPRHYWTQVIFPPMRGERLICADFFQESHEGFRTAEDGRSYDLILGNAPWGEKLLTEDAREWAKQNGGWPLANLGIGALFLPKCAGLLKDGGRIAMIQSASSLLFNRHSRAVAFRKKLLEVFRVEEIVNLSALRFRVFKRKTHAVKTSISPACVIVMSNNVPSPDDRIAYVSPKQVDDISDDFQIVVEPHDRRMLTVREAVADSQIWSILMWGSNRDRALLRRLEKHATLRNVDPSLGLRSREGIIFGDRQKLHSQLAERRMLDVKAFPSGSLLELDIDNLPTFGRAKTHSRDSTDFSAFGLPQLIVKQGWQKEAARFQARMTRTKTSQGALTSQSYLSIHVPARHAGLLEAACITLNSMFATYFLMLTSGRFATYRPEPLVEELLSVPLPPQTMRFTNIETISDIDHSVFDAFELKDAERVLIEDLFNLTLPDFQGNQRSLGRRKTTRASGAAIEPELTAYCKYFSRVIKAGFGQDKRVKATIFEEEQNSSRLPYRMVAFELGGAGESSIDIASIKLPELLQQFMRLNSEWTKSAGKGRNIFSCRVARIYDSSEGNPTIFMLKPDLNRYWTRSNALNDADDVALDIFKWHQAAVESEGAN